MLVFFAGLIQNGMQTMVFFSDKFLRDDYLSDEV
jgi:hypothetical protein